jgi:predicted NBD/HSP70 family sugar kinase
VANNAVYKQVACLQEPTREYLPERALVDRICAYIMHIADQLAVGKEQILGVGIAMPGLIENETGNVLFSPDFKWNNIPLRSWLQSSLSFPILVENSNRALALNESYLDGEEEPAQTTFSINLGHGSGAGLVMGDQLYTSSGGTSGEFGHITVIPEGPPCMCGNRGCLEAVASGMAITAQAQKAARHNRNSKLTMLCGGDFSKIDAKMVFQAADLGDKPALAIIDAAAEYIGIGIAMAVNVLDPDRIILCGGLMKNGPHFFEKIKISVEKHKMYQTGHHMVLSSGAKGEYSTANGACRVLANNLWWRRALPI